MYSFNEALRRIRLTRLTKESMGVYQAILEVEADEDEYLDGVCLYLDLEADEIFPDLIEKREKHEKFWETVSTAFWWTIFIVFMCVAGFFLIPLITPANKIDQLMLVIFVCTWLIVANLKR